MEQEPMQSPAKVRPWLLITAIVVVVGAAGYFGWYFLSGPGKKVEPAPTASVSATPTSSTASSNRNTSTTTAANNNTGDSKVDEPTSSTESKPTSAKPELKGVFTYDNNANGKIDEINVQFENYDLDKNITSLKGFSISEYSISSANGTWNSFGTYSPPDRRASLPILSIPLREGNAFDTDANPIVKYDGSLGELKNASGVKVRTFTKTASDSAGPVLVSAVASDVNNKSGIQDGDKVTLTFSETIVTEPAISISKSGNQNIDEQFILSSGHTWFSGEDLLKSVSRSADQKVLVVALSVFNGAPTIAVGDTITADGGCVKDTANGAYLNGNTNAVRITGSF